MKIPVATYRIQLSPDFPLEELGKITGYLGDLGISTIYSAPFFQSRSGSAHGYDILDPFTINREICSLKEFRLLKEDLDRNNMGWLQDIVPNHMAFDPQNIWLRDIFELGPESKYFRYFDINWKYRKSNKLMAPFLGAPLEEVLEKEQLNLSYEKGFFLEYFEHRFPVSARSYAEILPDQNSEGWKERFSEPIVNRDQWQDLKTAFYFEVEDTRELRQKLTRELDSINASPERLRAVLELQYFFPVHWKETEQEINYRRFFTINDLICLRMEEAQVFRDYHYFIGEMVENGLLDGLRIDHIDGLFDPGGYLANLRKLVGQDLYLVAEKILERDENIPRSWPVQGSSGYEFLALVNQLLTSVKNEAAFSQGYKELDPQMPEWENLLYRKKLFILRERMGGELSNLFYFLTTRILTRESTDPEKDRLKEALCCFLSGFPVYRIYPEEFPLSPQEEEIIDLAFGQASTNFPELREELELILSVFKGEAEAPGKQMLYFLKRCQQFTGPLAAKGGEDTAYYIFNRLVSHNEVGDSPGNFGISAEKFHQRMLYRNKNFPFSLNATATHDTKRGEDSRMRLNVLSEIPKEWFGIVGDFIRASSSCRKSPDIPNASEEYFIYQTLLGAMPFKEEEDFLSRTTAYLQKVLREAKLHSSWAEPEQEYESMVSEFISDILSNKEFRKIFDPFQKKIASYGIVKSLAQCLIKITAPGIPDIYQGSELWDLSYVDPDNRRPVDYLKRKLYLDEIKEIRDDHLKDHANHLKTNPSSGKIKMFCLHLALLERRNNPAVFQKGTYLPLEISGAFREKVLAFARFEGRSWILVVIPLEVSGIFEAKDLSQVENSLSGTNLILPREAPANWISIYTGEEINLEKQVPLDHIFADFPVVLLSSK